MFVCVRFVDEIIQILDASEVKTMKQFTKCRMEDVDWPAGTPGGKKVFLRMALEGVAATETEHASGNTFPKTSDSDRWCITVLGHVSSSVFCSCVHRQELALERKQELEQMKAFYMGKTKRLEQVNLALRVAEIGLEPLVGSESWPELAACRELRTKAKQVTGEGFSNPYVYADLRK